VRGGFPARFRTPFPAVVVALISVSTGHSAEYLTGAVGAGREDYYTGAVAEGEPPGTWRGRGAAALGLVGQVDAEVMHAVFGSFTDPRDPAFADESTRDTAGRLGRAPKRFRTPDEVVAARVEEYTKVYSAVPAAEQVQAWQIEAERSTPQAVMFYDLTFSVPKSVTVLWAAYSRASTDAVAAGDTATAERMAARAYAIEDAIAAANAVMLDHVEAQTASRIGRHGGGSRSGGPATGRWVDTPFLAVASFPQHTSRERDPQLHTHNAVLNRVQCPDGQWRAIDGKSLYGAKASASAIAGLELRERLARELGVSWVLREDGNDFEVAGIEQHEMDMLSSRARTLTAKAEQLVREFEEHTGRAATAWEQRCLRQQATLATRPAKNHDGETRAEMLDRADAAMRTQVVGGLGRIADRYDANGAGAYGAGPSAPTWSPEAVIAQAVEACHGEGGRSTFTRSELSRRITLALPGTVGLTHDGQARELVDHLTDIALSSELVVQTAGLEVGDVPDEHRLADGRAATIAPDAVRYAARGHVAAEHAVLRAAGVRGRTRVERAAAEAWLDDAGVGLNPAQREAVRGLATSDAALAVLIGPAGTGKSYTVGRLAEAWSDLTGGRVVGVATAQVAADVLRDDGVPDTANTTAFLTAQDRLAEGRAMPADHAWRLSERDILVVDEASMVDTDTLTRLQHTADAAGARVVLLGDPRQLGAVGAGGMMRTVLKADAEVHTLGEVRRFTADWERSASLRLRDGRDDVAAEYDRRGRLVQAGTEAAAVAAVARAAAADRLSGRHTVVVAASNRLAGEVSAAVRRHLVAAGQVEETGVILGRDRCTAGAGDLVQARRIDRGLGLTNRETYRVLAVAEDGGLDVASTRTGEVRRMPPQYVAADACLAYAGTVHATQGATVDAGHVLLTPGMSSAAAYVGLTRGRDANTAWAVTDNGIPDTPPQTARAMLADAIAAEDRGDLSAHDIAADDERHRTSAETLLALTEDHARLACRQRLDADLDQLVADGALSEPDRARFGSDAGSEHLARQLRALEQAGIDPAAALREGVTRRSLDTAASVAQVVSDRIDRAHGLPVPDHDAQPGSGSVPERVAAYDADYLAQLAALTDERRHQLGAACADDPPAWAVATLGPVPDATTDASDGAARAEWIERAGVIAAHREATGWTSDEQALGRCPGIHTPEKRADWHRAYAAAGMPEERRPDAELADGRLLARVAAADRVLAAAPDFVDPAMRHRHLAAEQARRDAALADSLGDGETAARLGAEAAAHADAAARLTDAGDERGRYLALHAETLTAGDAARHELARRGIDPATAPDRTTATELLAADRQARRADDAHRVITETDLTHDTADESTADAASEAADAAVAGAGCAGVPAQSAGAQNGVTDPVAAGENAPAGARAAKELSAEASEAEILAAAARAAAIAEQAADLASQNATEPDDHWERTHDHEAADHDTWDHARDAASDEHDAASWSRDDVADTSAL
jgi:conjugative relaxase-like TrwC/TraI family protein